VVRGADQSSRIKSSVTGYVEQRQGQLPDTFFGGKISIYLVLWFGHKPKPHNRTKPTSAANFQQRLIKLIGPQDSMRLQVRLQVVVLDLSLPS
jgi:hypothetical protein